MRRSYLLSILLLFVLGCAPKRYAFELERSEPDPRWARVNALRDSGLYASALDAVQPILDSARASNDQQLEFRALTTRADLREMVGTEAVDVIAELEERSRTADAPLAQLLHSVVGERYWNVYENDRWRIIGRTNTTDDPQDVATWGQQAFMRKVIAEYRASLEPAELLKSTPVDSIGELIHGHRGTRVLRPTLFDLLAHRALEVFTNTETRIAEPASRFTIDDPRAFVLFEDFAYKPFVHRDSTSWEFQALQLYQALEGLHLRDTAPEALVDVMLARLVFVHDRSTVPEKDSLYNNALSTLRTRVEASTAWSEVTVAMARVHQGNSARYQRLAGDEWKWEKKKAIELCELARTRFPGSLGAGNAEALQHQLLMPGLSMECEEAVLPDAPFRVALTHANTEQVWLRILPYVDPPNDPSSYDYEIEQWLVKQKPLREWSVTLPDDGDMNEHMVELPVDAVPVGRYRILLCNGADFDAEVQSVLHTQCWVTRLALTDRDHRNRIDVLVQDRGTGKERAGVNVKLWHQDPGSAARQKMAEFVTNAEGRAPMTITTANGPYSWELTDGVDHYMSGSGWVQNVGENYQVDPLRTFLFTDRAIYRPGQPVYFKGIVTERDGKSTRVRTQHRTTVEFYDVNDQKVDSVVVTTDAFGAFHGTFTAPLGALTGWMTIREAHGAQGFRVEEYKRPTFEVTFDPIAGQPKLGEEATITGTAKSYAGVPLDGAQVQWTVKRGARMPWWCDFKYRGGWFPWGEETEAANGTATCDAQGHFTVKFKALANAAFPRAADPTFHFDVEASATDLNGETQSGTTALDLGYRSIEVDIAVGESLERNATDSLLVRVLNLNGQEVMVPFDVRITKLVPPDGVLRRDRAWDRPDQFVLTQEEHGRLFPQEVYAQETDPLTWERASTSVGHHKGVPDGKPVPLNDVRSWEVGNYLIEASARDASGTEVRVQKVVTLFDTAIQNTGFVNEAFHAERVKTDCEPGQKAAFVISSALPEARVLMEVERKGEIVISRWFTLAARQQLIELPVSEDDRGGFAVHLLCIERGRAHRETIRIDVPWTNKELKTEWMSFRDKLQPGDKEEWRLRITGSKGEQVAAQLLAGMYDASLDRFAANAWSMDVWEGNEVVRGWGRSEPFGAAAADRNYIEDVWFGDSARSYERLTTTWSSRLWGYSQGWTLKGNGRAQNFDGADAVYYTYSSSEDGVHNMVVGDVPAQYGDKREEVRDGSFKDLGEPEQGERVQQPAVVRSDFRETAFFLPDLLTDRDGALVLRFTTPDALTRWKVMGLAHTADLRTGSFTREVITQKPLMVFPNLPRFLREGDRITLTTKINLVEGDRAEGTATLELFDPFTNTSLNTAFGLTNNAQPFVASPGESAVVAWSVKVPEGVSACGVRIVATSIGGPRASAAFSDGEERVLPVLTDRILLTESLPLWISKAGTKTFTLEKLKSNNSTTLRNRSLTLEYTPNPAWFAVQALPYLMEFPHECAEQTFSRFYANALAIHIVEERPAIKKVFEQWSAPSKSESSTSFLTALEKNPELKTALLAETPWVLQAQSDKERQQRIALLFDLQRMASEEATAQKKLREMQLPNGAWPWWTGMQESRSITQHIVAGMGHLEKLHAVDTRPNGQAQEMLRRGVNWLDEEVVRAYKELQRNNKKEEMEKYVPGYTEIQFLYARSFFMRWPMEGTLATAIEFYKERARAAWTTFGLQEQAMLALALHRTGDDGTAQLIMASLSERATRSEELGMYWKDFRAGFYWYEMPAETHALLIEAYDEVMQDKATVNELRTYLLKLKQTTDWKTTKATSEACYALLLTGDDWLENSDMPSVKVGGTEVAGNIVNDQQAGTGAFERTWSAAEVKPAMGEVTITTTADKPSWGALHWQYFEQMDKVTPHESPLSIKKQVMLTRETEHGPQLVALGENAPVKVGDKLTVRIEIRTDRYVDFVHLKDLRAAGLEPTEAISGYHYQDGLGYYQSIRDASMNFFFDRIAPGTHVFEYTLRVAHAGDFSNGVSTIQCMYAPEFSSHSQGLRVVVGE